MTNRKRWSRAAIALTFSVITILGATVGYGWIQQERAIIQAKRAYALAQNYNAQSNGSGLSLQNAPAQSNNNLTPNASGSVSFARVVRNSLPMEQHALVTLVLSTQKNINSERKTEARNQLMRLVEQELDGRFSSQAAELSLLEKRVAEAKEKLAQRVKRKEEIVERRMAELLSEPDELAWNTETNFPSVNPPLASSLPPLQANNTQFNNNTPAFQPAPYIANPAAEPAAGPGGGIPLNFSVPMSNIPSEPIPPASATEPIAPLDEPATAPKTSIDLATLLEDVIDLESEFEELDGLTPEGKIEAVQRLTLRKRLRRLELGLEAVMKKAEDDDQLLALNLNLAIEELLFSEQKFDRSKELSNKGAAASSEVKETELELARAKHKVIMLRQDREAQSHSIESISARIQTLRKKLDGTLEVQKPAPEVKN